jgi:hypothetical protein
LGSGHDSRNDSTLAIFKGVSSGASASHPGAGLV